MIRQIDQTSNRHLPIKNRPYFGHLVPINKPVFNNNKLPRPYTILEQIRLWIGNNLLYLIPRPLYFLILPFLYQSYLDNRRAKIIETRKARLKKLNIPSDKGLGLFLLNPLAYFEQLILKIEALVIKKNH